jgi:uncharacterized membrane protein (UPF0182 family)
VVFGLTADLLVDVELTADKTTHRRPIDEPRIVRLPGEPQAEFLQMLPMVPGQRQNMIAWLAARSDQPDYGKLIVYEFPKEKPSTARFRSRR